MSSKKSDKSRKLATNAAQGRVIKQCYIGECGAIGAHAVKKIDMIAFILDHYNAEVSPNASRAERQVMAANLARDNGYKSVTSGRKAGLNRKSDRAFYDSWEWKQARFEALTRHGRRCLCCGWSPQMGGANYLCVDHIKPRSKFPELELDLSNLQVLCNDCNKGKSNIYTNDFRDQ